jgi:hypothetical protein
LSTTSIPKESQVCESCHLFRQAYRELLENELEPLIPQGLAAAIYTQITDVEIEINGYLTYDRQVEKMDVETLRKVHTLLYLSFGKAMK